jgi:hypothetical protein
MTTEELERLEAFATVMQEAVIQLEHVASRMEGAASAMRISADTMATAARTMPTHITHDRH